jgi:hypothetical protein
VPDQSQIAGVVERSRLGDQNATAIITCVRERAESGNPLAKQSLQAIVTYAKQNPPGKRSEIGGVFTRLRSSLGALRDAVRRCVSREDYIEKVKSGVPNVGLTMIDAQRASAALTNGPEIGPDELATAQATFDTDAAKKAFQYAVQLAGSPKKVMGAVQKNKDPQLKKALHLGYVMGAARRVQMVRKPDSVLMKFSPVVAWELGEDQA